jgi:CHAT domain-containing protein
VAGTLLGLGALARDHGDLEAAQEYYERALAIHQTLAPNSLDVATSLNNLGLVALDQGDLAAAQEYHQQALTIKEKLAPNSLDVAHSLNNVGAVARSQGDLAAAQEYLQRALAIREKLAPNSLDLARSLHELAKVARQQRKWAEAERLSGRAWSLVRHQGGTVTGDEARQAFGSFNIRYAASLLPALLAQRKVGPAFQVLEESRAQALLQLLAERHLDLATLPASLQAEYRTALAARDRAQHALDRVSIAHALAQRELGPAIEAPHAPPERAAQAADLEQAAKALAQAHSAATQARLRVEQLWSQIQKHTPRAFVPPLSLSQAQHVLPPDTLYLAFAVGEEQVHLFLLQPGLENAATLSVHPLALSPRQLQEQVEAFRLRIASPSSRWLPSSRTLFRHLFPPPARKALLSARRVLLSPEGFLWDVPFAALVLNAQGPPRCLGIEKPLTYTLSLTLFAEARQNRPRRSPEQLPTPLVVGNPLFARRRPLPPSDGVQPSPIHGERALLFSGDEPPAPLPGTGEEAIRIARLYGGSPLTGAGATEAAVRRQLEQADVVHLATHGYLDSRRAMSSGVLLAAPEKEPQVGETADDGLLQAWEIYSQVKLKAELVVLSACETGRGEQVAGEGIVGLTRALQYAGARSIVASQWPVADRSTARLMVAFHRKLREGKAKDEALRQAMASVQREERTAHPYYWAPFFLTGDPDSHYLGAADSRSRQARKRTGN